MAIHQSGCLKSLTENQQDVLFIYLFSPKKCLSTGWLVGHLGKSLVQIIMQRAKTIMSITLGIMDFAIMLLKKNSVLNLANRQVKFFGITVQKYFNTNFKFLINSHEPTKSHFKFI